MKEKRTFSDTFPSNFIGYLVILILRLLVQDMNLQLNKVVLGANSATNSFVPHGSIY